MSEAFGVPGGEKKPIEGAADLRELLRTRQTRDEEFSQVRKQIVLDVSLVRELEELDRERALIVAPFDRQRQERRDDPRLGDDLSMADIDEAEAAATAEIDGRRDALRAQIADATVEVRFQAVPASVYQQVLNQVDDTQTEEGQARFYALLTQNCYRGAWYRGQKTDLKWAEIVEHLNWGEAQAVHNLVFAANRTVVDLPFLSER